MEPRRFATTRWTLVLAASATDAKSPQARDALAALCETYWFPVYSFIRRSGRPTEDARDLTQAFFTRVLEKNYFKDAKQERGRFRSFLLTSVRNFLSNQHDWDVAQKRGGGQSHLSLEFDDGDRRYSREPVDDALTPDEIYERNWATSVLADAMARLEAGQDGAQRKALFRHLKPFLTGDDPKSYAELGGTLKIAEGTLRVAVHRLREQFGKCLRETIAETVESPEDIDEELRHLLTVVSR
jgi:RNA polymerase sigma-70 factor (ECF subfamily)